MSLAAVWRPSPKMLQLMVNICLGTRRVMYDLPTGTFTEGYENRHGGLDAKRTCVPLIYQGYAFLEKADHKTAILQLTEFGESYIKTVAGVVRNPSHE